MQKSVEFLHLFISWRAASKLFSELFNSGEHLPHVPDARRQFYHMVVDMVTQGRVSLQIVVQTP